MRADASTYMFPFNAIVSFVLDEAEGQDFTFSDPPYSSNIDSGKVFFIVGTCLYLLYGLTFITSQLLQWVLDLNKRLSSSKRHVHITDIPPQERLKVISFSNYLKTPDQKGLKGIGETHKGIRQLMINPRSL